MASAAASTPSASTRRHVSVMGWPCSHASALGSAYGGMSGGGSCSSFAPSASARSVLRLRMRRCWRFGQENPVEAYVVVSELEQQIVDNVRRKETEVAGWVDRLVWHIDGRQ